jgi:hypothetical protein
MIVACAALAPGASAKSAAVSCPSYRGTFALTDHDPATFTKVKASGISCRLADKAFRTAPIANPGVVVTVSGVSFAMTLQYLHTGFNIRLVEQPPKSSGDTITAHVTIK